MKFIVREILDATPRSRVASQFGAQKGDRASKRLTRRPATHNRNSDSRARSHATADCLRIIHARCRCMFTDCPCPCLVADMGCSWTRPFAQTEHDRGLFADTDNLHSRPVRIRDRGLAADSLFPLPLTVHGRGHLHGLNVVVDCSRTWTNHVRGLPAASARLQTDRGHVHNSGK